MTFEISKDDIIKELISQLTSFFSVSREETIILNLLSETVFKRCEINFSKNKNKYYSKSGEAYFNPYHSGQYTVFLYYFSTLFLKMKASILG